MSRTRCSIVPPYLLRRLADAAPSPEAAARLERMLALDDVHRSRRVSPVVAPIVQGAVAAPAWTVYSARHLSTLPGDVVRRPNEPATGDAATDEAATGIAAALAMYAEVYDRRSYDGHGAPVTVTVHYEQDYDNAFWDGTQLVFGDGDGRVFDRFTKPVDVLGHELTHAVTERTAGLTYQGQSGALNESVSDAFACCLKQRLLGQTADQADWLIGAGIFLPGIAARGLRDMAHPGTAYDDPQLGKDPQAPDMSGYLETTDDNGGVHTNSGIPNRAFYLAAVGIGGHTWEAAGRVWYAALTGGDVGPDTDFAGFAAATVAAAGEHGDVVRQAWEAVGVTPAPGRPAASPAPAPRPAAARTVSVRRTGGFAGTTTDGLVDLDADPEHGPELASLVDRIDLASVSGLAPTHADRFTYDFDLCGEQARVPEQHLTDDLRRVVDLVLR